MEKASFLAKNKLAIILVGIFVTCIVVLSCGVIAVKIISSGNNSDDKTKSGSEQKMTTEECAKFASEYDRKVLKISGEGITGTVGLIANTEECRIEAHYQLVMQANLVANPMPKLPYLYNYIALIHTPTETKRMTYYGIGVIFPAYTNKTSVPSDSFASQVSDFYAPGELSNNTTVTDTFYATPERLV